MMDDTGQDKTAPAPAAAPVAKATPRGVKIALILSLAANLLVAGIVGGAILNHERRGFVPRAEDVGFGPFTEALDDKDRRFLRDEFMKRSPRDFRDIRDEARAGFDTLLSALRAPQWDEAPVRAAFEAQRTRTEERIALGQDLMLDRIGQMTAEERAAFADRIEKALKRGRGRD